MNIDFKNINGLALAAGGARGAYQAGALLALAEIGFSFEYVAGTSVGAVNGAFYIQGSGSVVEMQTLCSLWREISKIGVVKIRDDAHTFFTQFQFIRSGSHILDPGPLKNVLDKYLDYKAICSSSKKLIITTIPSLDPISDILTGSFQKPIYFRSAEINEELFRKALLAAIAIPVAFPSISIDNCNFTDGGLSVPLPSKCLYDDGVRKIVSIFLSDTILQNRADYPDALIFQVRPSVNISTHFMSMLDFSPETIENLISLGYSDTKKYVHEIISLSDEIRAMSNNSSLLNDLINKLPF